MLVLGSSVQFSHSVVSDSLQPRESQHARPPCPSPTPGVHPNSCASSWWCHPVISSSVVPFSSCPQSSIRVFSNESTLRMRWAKYWSFSLSISPSNEHPGPISFRMDWLDLLAVQGTHKSLLQHHSSKASILWRSAFFIVQLSHPYMTTWKTIDLTRQTFVGKVISLFFNMLYRLVITFLPRSTRSDWIFKIVPQFTRHPQWLRSKESACNAEDTGGVGLSPGLGRSPGRGHGNPLQYSGKSQGQRTLVGYSP